MAEPLAHLQGKYEILEKLREGGMGAIYKVRHLLLEEVRVIKVLRPQLRSDERLRQRFLREARTAIRVRHPNIAQLYDCVIDDESNAFIVMEYIEGITFQEMLTAGGAPALGVSLELAVQTLDALATIHRKGIIHRDISPDNIMFCADEDGMPVVKLIDLGIAKVLKGDGGLTETGTFLGKVRYASPEHFTGDGQSVDERSDLYSFGVVLYEMVTGLRPFTGNDVASLIAAHLFRGPLDFADTDPDGKVPEPLRAAILTALAKEPEARYQSAGEFLSALRALKGEHAFTADEVRQALAEHHEIDTMPIRVRKPGSTQAKLDRQFGVGPTPAPKAPDGGDVDPLRAVDETLRSPPPKVADPEELQSLVASAKGLMRLGRREEARAQVEVVLRLDPTSSAAHALMQELEQPAEKSAEADWMQEIDSLLLGAKDGQTGRKGRSPATGGGSRRAQATGEPSGASQPAAIDARAAERQTEACRLAAEAAELLEQGRAEAAAQRLEQALILQPEDATIRQQLAVANAAVHDQRRAEELERIGAFAARVEKALGEGDVESATSVLEDAEAEVGEREPLRELRVRIEQEKARRATVLSCLQRARELLAADRPDDALAALSPGAELDPESTEIRELVAASETRKAELETERKTSAARETFRSQLAAGDVDGAAMTLAVLEERLAPEARAELTRDLEAAQLRRRAEELVRAGEHAIAEKAFDEALQLLGRALTFSPEDSRANELFERASEQQRVRAQLDELLMAADQSERDGELSGTLQALESALELDPDSSEIKQRLDSVSQRLATAQRAARRAAELDAAVEQISQELDARQLHGAERAIEVAERVYGPAPQLAELRVRLARQQERDREEAVAPLLATARQCAMVEDYDGALAALRKAQEVAPGHLEVQHLTEMYASSARARREHQRHSRELAHAAVSIEALLSRGDVEEAERALDLAEKMFGVQDEIAELRRRLDGSCRAGPGDPAATVERALRALDEGRRGEAVGLLRDAQQLAPDDARVQGLLDEVMRREAEASIEAHIERGEMERARWTLDLALGMYGRVGRLPGLEEEIQQAGR